jgi:hypothetical protein
MEGGRGEVDLWVHHYFLEGGIILVSYSAADCNECN